MAWELYLLAFRIFWRRLGLLLVGNLLWILLSLFIVTWPAATAGLFYLVRRIIDEELLADPQGAVIGDFWVGFRQYWLRSTLLAVADLMAILLIWIAIRFYGEGPSAISWLVGPLTLFAIVWIGMQSYVYPLFIQREVRNTREIAREAFLMTIGYPVNTALFVLTLALLTIPAVVLAGPILLIYFSLIALLQTMYVRGILVRRGEIALQLSPEQRERRERSESR